MNISGTVFDSSPTCGDGVIASIRKDNDIVWSQILPNGSTPVNFAISVNVTQGTQLRFITDRGSGNEWCDWTQFDPTISNARTSEENGDGDGIHPDGLKFFGHYSVQYPLLNFLDEVSEWSNWALYEMPWDYSEEHVWQKFSAKSVKAVVVPPWMYVQDPSGKDNGVAAPSGSDVDLNPDYKNIWANFVKNSGLKAHRNQVAAIYLNDEPFWWGVQCEDLKKVSKMIKETFPEIPQMFVEAYGGLDSMCAPDTVDYVGFDLYRIRNPETDATFQKALKKMKSKMSSQQKVVYVIDGFWTKGHQDQGLDPSDMAIVTTNYYRMAQKDPDAIGLLSFVWNNFTEGSTDIVGCKNLPQNVQNEHKRIGKIITGKK